MEQTHRYDFKVLNVKEFVIQLTQLHVAIKERPKGGIIVMLNPLTMYNPEHVAAVSILPFDNSELEESIRELGFLSGRS